ncbi:hypothetical protein NOF55_21735 [Rhizobiaceae bacterium BDR2-2]|uniref:Nuclear transport factor 2 family protein n=1 Tax=Ectorhizobium quercum TaxID=2965071 RepID=A0AAE3N3U7_9HYPH|nr:hypothetical protein [Ectorhizobium quercum]MCX8999731.1 hypothetical protein [Ectorhizobium quercum]
MKKAIRMFFVAMLAASAGTTNTYAQTAAEVDSSLDGLFGAHAPYRHFFEQLQKAVASDDKAAVAAMVDYPFQARINGKAVTLRDAAHFVADYDKIVTSKVKQAIAAQTYATLFANWQGVMIGDGELWFSGVGDGNMIKIIAIND